MKVDFSNLFSLNTTDFIKGLVMSVLGAVATAIYTALDNGGISGIDWSAVWKLALSTGLLYLIKNFFTPKPDTVVIDPTKTEVERKR